MTDPGASPPPEPRSGLRLAAPLLAVLAVIAYLLRGMFSSGYTEGSDTLAHLFRVQQMSGWLQHPGRLFDWTDLWYGGFHQFALYPYLSYVPAAILDAITGYPLVSMKLVMLGATLAGASGVYFASLELTRDHPGQTARALGAAGSAVAFTLSPAFLGFMFGFGEYSDFVALGFAPIVFVAFLTALRQDTTVAWVVYGVALAIVVLLHPHVGLCALIGHGVFLLFSPQASVRALLGATYACVLALALSLYFWLPFLALRESAGDPSLGTPFTHPIWAVEFGDYFDRERGLRYLGTVAVGFALGGALLRQYRSASVPLVAMLVAGAVLALGGTLPLSTNLPILDMINPERALVMVVPGMSLLAGFAISAVYRGVRASFNSWQSAAAALGVIALLVVDPYFFNERTARTVEFSDEFVAVNDYLKAQPGTPFDRVLMIQADYNLTAYSPVLSGKAVTDGSQVQGAKTPPDVATLGQLPEDNAGDSQLVALASRFNVRWIVVDREQEGAPAFIARLLEGEVVEDRYSRGRYVVLERTWQPSLVRAKGPGVLAIGLGQDAGLVADLSSELDIRPQRGASNRLDDYTVDTLAAYGIVILAEPEVGDRAATDEMLAAYERQGGRLFSTGTRTPAEPGDHVVYAGRTREIVANIVGGSGSAVASMGYSPVWEVSVDGVTVDTRSDRGLLSFDVSEGRHDIAVSYDMPGVARAGQVLSLLAWLATLAWLGWTLWRLASARSRGVSDEPAPS